MKKHEFKSLIRECIDEIVSDQMVGIQEVMQFYSNAPMDKIIEVEEEEKPPAPPTPAPGVVSSPVAAAGL